MKRRLSLYGVVAVIFAAAGCSDDDDPGVAGSSVELLRLRETSYCASVVGRTITVASSSEPCTRVALGDGPLPESVEDSLGLELLPDIQLPASGAAIFKDVSFFTIASVDEQVARLVDSSAEERNSHVFEMDDGTVVSIWAVIGEERLELTVGTMHADVEHTVSGMVGVSGFTPIGNNGVISVGA